MQNQKNMLLAFAISLVIILGWDQFIEKPKRDAAREIARQEALANPTPTPEPLAILRDRAEILEEGQRIKINTSRLHGSINLKGARLDDLTLADYRQTTDEDSPEVVLLSPQGATDGYFVESGWLADNIKRPDLNTVWSTEDTELAVNQPVTLSWDNGEGLLFKKIISLDEDYMFSIKQTVANTGERAVSLFPYARTRRGGIPPDFKGFFILHEGPLGVYNEQLEEYDYDDLADEAAPPQTTTGGWMGITDKYWLVALVPPQQMEVESATKSVQTRDGGIGYQVDWRGQGQRVEPGATVEVSTQVFAGAKEVELLDKYATTYEIPNFDLAVDWGWFYFLTRPFFWFLHWIAAMIGTWWPAILVMTLIVKLVMLPLANKSYVSMTKMKLLQPKMMELRERFENNPQKLQSEMMKLYKKEQVNPLSGCLPILVQIPIFFSLYKVLFVSIDMRHASFPGWIDDMSAPDPTTIFNLFGMIPWDPPSFLMLGAWPIIMGVTMFIQTKLNPTPPDPMQAKVMMFLPIMFTILLAGFPAGLVVYWAWNNVLSVGQQYFIQRKVVARIEEEAAAKSAGKPKGKKKDGDEADAKA
ncbi:MAG: membrane protein insertase YidC [Alphaproteobacteria bacterium]